MAFVTKSKIAVICLFKRIRNYCDFLASFFMKKFVICYMEYLEKSIQITESILRKIFYVKKDLENFESLSIN